jgi:sigma-B regulation protein RsbU (phosphoserine phosphatase)
VFIGDVSGHGTPAAVLMAITHAIAHSQPGTHTPPASLLTYLNQQLARAYTRDGLFVTAFYGVLDPQARTLTYSRAGHNPPRLVRNDQVLALDGAGSLPLGILEVQHYDETQIQLEPGDLLLLFTDGVTEASPAESSAPQTAGESEQFGTARLDALLRDCAQGAGNSQACLDRIRSAVSEHCAGAPPTDDQTLIAIRCL